MSARTATSAQQTINRLKTLVKAGELLNSSLDLDKILEVLLHHAMKNLHAERATIYLLDRKNKELSGHFMQNKKKIEIRLPLGQGIAGYVAKTGRTVRTRDAYRSKYFYRGIDRKSGFQTKTMLTTPMRSRDRKLIGVFQILNKKRGYFDKADEEFLAALSIPACIAIENARLHQSEILAQKMQRELEVAAAIQEQLLPHEIPAVRGTEVTALTKPCRAVGGDFYDIIEMDDHTLVLVIADVSGKGVSGALLVSALQASLHAYLELGLKPDELVAKLNRVIHESSTSENFITFVFCLYDAARQTLRYINAGHNYPIVLHARGGMSELAIGGVSLGMLPEAAYEEGEVHLDEGDLLMLYTDGVTEAMDKEHNLYGEARLYSRLNKFAGKNVDTIAEEILKDVSSFTDDYPQVDDFTMVLMKTT